MKKYALILAAGKGTRMNTDIPKCAIDFCGKSIIERIVDTCKQCSFDEIVVVVGYKSEYIKNILKDEVTYIYQKEQLGTANAVLCCKEYFEDKEGSVVIIPGDMPLIDSRTINKLMIVHMNRGYDFTFVSTLTNYPNQYGRIFRIEGFIKKIIEYKDCNEEQRKINEVNSGLYCANIKNMFSELSCIKNNNKAKEYYLTDLVEIFANKNKAGCYLILDDKKLMGVNDIDELNKAIKTFKNEQ